MKKSRQALWFTVITDYEYIVYNKSMTDSIDMQFNQVLTALNQMMYAVSIILIMSR